MLPSKDGVLVPLTARHIAAGAGRIRARNSALNPRRRVGGREDGEGEPVSAAMRRLSVLSSSAVPNPKS